MSKLCHLLILLLGLSLFLPDYAVASDALFEAVKNDDAAQVRLLLEAGTDPNSINKKLYTPLHLAKSPEVVALLLKAGANPNSRDDFGRTPLDWANDPALGKMLRNQAVIAERIISILREAGGVSGKDLPYFPEEIGISKFMNEWYSRHLFALEEPVIYTQLNQLNETNHSIYRFTCLRTFHRPFSIRIEMNEKNKRAYLFFRMSDGAGGYDPGNLIIYRDLALSRDEIENFVKVIGSYDYWAIPFEDNTVQGRDGSEWIIEMLKNGKYHTITRWTPGEHKQTADREAVYKLGVLAPARF